MSLLFKRIAFVLYIACAIGISNALAMADSWGVVRTMTHHQITSIPQGIWQFGPIVSDSGNRILYGVAQPAGGKSPSLAIVDYDGQNSHLLDNTPNIIQADLTGDGSKVIYLVASREIRIINADGTGERSLLKLDDGDIDAIRITGDGGMVFFLSARGMDIGPAANQTQYLRGLYAINTDGSNFHLVAGPNEVAKLQGVTPNDVGYNDFQLATSTGSIDVSENGSRVVFGCFVKSASVVFGCDSNGGKLHSIIQKNLTKGGFTNQFATIALSNDGTTLAYHALWPDELGVVRFDGTSQSTLYSNDAQFPWSFGQSVFITADGKRVTYVGYHFNADRSGFFELMRTHQQKLLSYGNGEFAAMDNQGRRFAYWMNPGYPKPLQLATLELNVAVSDLGGAPQINYVNVNPPAIPREKTDGTTIDSTVSAAVTTGTPPVHVSYTGFFNGSFDNTLDQNGQAGITDMLDDGKTSVSGDLKAGDGTYTRRSLEAASNAPDGGRDIRVEAQITATDGTDHASVVEIGPYPVVNTLPPANSTALAVIPPPPPSAVVPSPTVASSGTGASPTKSGGSTGTASTPAPTGTPSAGSSGSAPPTPSAAPIDLTGFWTTEAGGTYYIRQIGASLYWDYDDLPRSHNIFFGTITGSTITGTWIDLPGATISTGSGTISLTIVSDDKLTKISPGGYAGSVWTRISAPIGTTGASAGGSTAGATGSGGSTPGSSTGGRSGGCSATAFMPWQTPQGQNAIDQWIAVAMAKLNAFDGGAEINGRKPYSINKYGVLVGTGIQSAAAPDNFANYGNNKYWFMWDNYVPSSTTGWTSPQWNEAGVPALHEYVNQILAAEGK